MYVVGEEEIEAIARVIRSGKLFRYGEEGQCATFEKRYAAYLGVDHFALSASGTFALTAGLTAMGIGPGDEVIIPAHTYMATATAVLAVGAIPVIVDVDESITISPKAIRAAIGPHTKAIIPVHMWGATCDMDAIMGVAREHNLQVLEDCCQGVGGSYKGRKLGSIGHAGAFSFNYYKNITSGEGGGLATSDRETRRKGALRHRPLRILLAGQERQRAAVRRQRRPGFGDHGRDAERPARPARRPDRQDAKREAAHPRRHPSPQQSRP